MVKNIYFSIFSLLSFTSFIVSATSITLEHDTGKDTPKNIIHSNFYFLFNFIFFTSNFTFLKRIKTLQVKVHCVLIIFKPISDPERNIDA